MKSRCRKWVAYLLCTAIVMVMWGTPLETYAGGNLSAEETGEPEDGTKKADKNELQDMQKEGNVVSGGDTAAAAVTDGNVLRAAAGKVYYVDSAQGSDDSAGTSQDQAWKSLDKINSTVFQPGDRILLKSGSIWAGQLWPKGSGTPDAPIIMDRYGDGPLPLIVGNVAMDNAKDNDYYRGAALVLHNQEYWEVNNLEITNTDPSTSTGPDADTDKTAGYRRMGVSITTRSPGDGKETYRHIYLNGLYIHDISGSIDRNNGGILVTNQYGENRTNFEDVRIENCTITNIIGNGITTTSDYILQYMGTDETGGSPTRWGEFPGRTTVDWGAAPQFKSKDILVSGCSLSNIWCDGILTINVDHPVIEYNVCSNTCYAYGAYAAIWPHSSNDALIQYNEVYDTRYVGGDGQAFDVDYNCDNAVLQYNYSHDNEGGFLLLMESANYPVVRYNISQNDGTKGTTIGLMDLNAGFVQIYNNTFYSDVPVFSTRIEGGLAGNGVISNNIFCASEPVTMGNWKTDVKKSYDYHNNAVFGYSSLPQDADTVTADPGLKAPGTAGFGLRSVDGYQLEPDSPCIDAGTAIADNGGKDYQGNPLTDEKTDIGAFEALVKADKGDDIKVKATGVLVTSEGGRMILDKKQPTLQFYAEVLPFEADIHQVEWKVTSLEGRETALAQISPEGLLTGYENGSVRVIATAADGSGAYGSMTVTLEMSASSSNQVVDDLNIDDFSKMYEHSGELWMDKNGADYFGDNARLIRSNKFDTSFIRYATYNYERISGFKVTAYYQNYSGAQEQEIEDIRFYMSEDNENWTEITQDAYLFEDKLLERGPEGGSLWTKRVYTCSGLDGRDNYFKVTFPQQYSQDKYYDPNIGQIILDLAAEVEELQIISEADEITRPGGTLELTAMAYPEAIPCKAVNWTVTNPDGSATSKASISADGVLTAYNNGEVLVNVVSRLDSSITASRKITISGQPANILDTYTDFSKIWKENGLQLEYVGWFAGGMNTIHPYAGSSDRYMIYQGGNIRGFRVDSNFLTGEVRKLDFYTSQDGETFLPLDNVPFDETDLGGTAGRSYHMENLPDGVNFLKIRFEEGFSWEANVTKTQLFFDSMEGMELRVVSPADSIETYNGQLQMAVEPENVAVDWRVLEEDGSPSGKASIDAQGLLTGRSKGTVYVQATARADQSVTAVKKIEINTKVYQEIHDDFRYAEGFETGNADHLLNKTLEHSGGYWHQKIDWAGSYGLYVHDWMNPSYVTYECDNLVSFRVKTLCRYDFEEGADFVIKGSSDRENWVEVTGITKESSGGNWPTVTYSKEGMDEGYRYLRVEFPAQAAGAASNINLCGVDLISEIRVGTIEIQGNQGAVEGEKDSFIIPSLGGSIQFTAKTDTAEIPGLISWSVQDEEKSSGQAADRGTSDRKTAEGGSSRAFITQDGVLTAVDYGRVLVTATATDGSGISKTVRVEIASVHPESIVLNKHNKIMETGDVLDLKYRISPSNAVNQKVTFTSSDSEVASVTEKGRVMALKAGEADITVTTEDGGITAVCRITVSGAKAFLEKIIAEAGGLVREDYLAESWNIFAEALENADKVLADKTSRKQDWQNAAEKLQAAVKGLVNREEASGALKALVNRALAIDFTQYTEESYAPVQEALAYAKTILEAGNNASESDIAVAQEQLENALAGLEEKGPEDDGNGEEKPGEDDNQGGNDGDGSTDGGSDGGGNEDGGGDSGTDQAGVHGPVVGQEEKSPAGADRKSPGTGDYSGGGVTPEAGEQSFAGAASEQSPAGAAAAMAAVPGQSLSGILTAAVVIAVCLSVMAAMAVAALKRKEGGEE